jgi:hypothetical protein
MPLNCTESLQPLDDSGGDDTSTKPAPATTNDEATAHKHVAVLVRGLRQRDAQMPRGALTNMVCGVSSLVRAWLPE